LAIVELLVPTSKSPFGKAASSRAAPTWAIIAALKPAGSWSCAGAGAGVLMGGAALGAGVGVGGAGLGAGVGVLVDGVALGVGVGAALATGVLVGAGLAPAVGVLVGAAVAPGVGVLVGAGVAPGAGLLVGAAVAPGAGVLVAAGVAVREGPLMGVGVAARGLAPTVPDPAPGALVGPAFGSGFNADDWGRLDVELPPPQPVTAAAKRTQTNPRDTKFFIQLTRCPWRMRSRVGRRILHAMIRSRLVVIDYGGGNIGSLVSALERRCVAFELSADTERVAAAGAAILPGDGAFAATMQALKMRKLDGAIRSHVQAGKPFLGICVGMQVLFESSNEYGAHRGLAILPGNVRRFTQSPRVPHMGWNELWIEQPHPFIAGLQGGDYAYFLHSYRVSDGPDVVASTEYGERFAAIVARDNVMATQFHPEKSARTGGMLLDNFLRIAA
jgi:glutamine amidotransferase